VNNHITQSTRQPEVCQDGTISSLDSVPRNRAAMAMMTAVFFTCGFLATMNDVLIPHLKPIFELNYAEVMLIQFSFFSAFLFFSVPSGKLVERLGYKGTLVAGLLTMSFGAVLFIPAASLPSFPVFLTALIVLASGVTALQVSGNPYVSLLGSPRTASSRLNLTQAFNSLGSTIAPYVGGMLILRAIPKTADQLHEMSPSAWNVYRAEQAASLKIPYLGIAITLALLGLIVARYRFPIIHVAENLKQSQVRFFDVLKHRHVVLGTVAIFVYCGAEIAIGGFLVSYLIQDEIGHLTARAASRYVSIYWGGSMIGRFLGSAVLQKVATSKVLSVTAISALTLVTISITSYGQLAMWSMLWVGLFNSIMFPSIFTLGIGELGPLTGKGSGILMAAAVGGAVIPVLEGMLADRIGVHYSFLLPALCYVYVGFYALYGCRPGVFLNR
jgi:FHS family L-fucose permease-like MFS transporter